MVFHKGRINSRFLIELQIDDRFFSLKKMETVLDQQDADLMKAPEKFEKMPELYESDESESEV